MKREEYINEIIKRIKSIEEESMLRRIYLIIITIIEADR